MAKDMKGPINPFALGGGFLNYCVNKGLVVQKEEDGRVVWFVTKKGEKELRERFGIEKY